MNFRAVLTCALFAVLAAPSQAIIGNILGGALEGTKKFWGGVANYWRNSEEVPPEIRKHAANFQDTLGDVAKDFGKAAQKHWGRRGGGGKKKDEVCYKGVGCFSKGESPWTRPNEELPESPRKVGVHFLLFDRSQNPDTTKGKPISPNRDSIEAAGFNARRPTIMIVHSIFADSDKPWIHKMRARLLYAKDCNVITVDWKRGAKPRMLLAGLQPATANVRLVGAIMEKLYKALERLAGADRDDFHCIGHSMGAHVCGEFGARLSTPNKRLGRITGLDPMGKKAFERRHSRLRLDSTDAWFVDVIHTDTMLNLLRGGVGSGAKTAMGHVDFYPNSGRLQPGCTMDDNSETMQSNAFNCASAKAIEFFTDTIYNKPECQFISIPCSDAETFEAGQCYDCGENGCARMGFYAPLTLPKNYRGKSIKYFLKLPKSRPYCTNPYHVFVKVLNVDNSDIGKLSMTVHGSGGSAKMSVPLKKATYDAEKQAYKYMVMSADYIRKPTALRVKLEGHVPGLKVKGIVITAGFGYSNSTSALFSAGRDSYLESYVQEEHFVTRYISKGTNKG